MSPRLNIPVVCAVLLIVSLCLLAQAPLTNDSIVKLVKAGLGDDVIVGMVDVQPAKYSLSPDDLIALKKEGVSDKIIAAMLKKSAAAPPSEPAKASAPGGLRASRVQPGHPPS